MEGGRTTGPRTPRLEGHRPAPGPDRRQYLLGLGAGFSATASLSPVVLPCLLPRASRSSRPVSCSTARPARSRNGSLRGQLVPYGAAARPPPPRPRVSRFRAPAPVAG